MGELFCATFTQCLLIFDHIALLIPSLLREFIELNFQVSLVVILILQVVVVAHDEVLVIVKVAFTDLLHKVLEVRLADDFLRVS